MRSESLARRGSDCRGLEGQQKACEFGFKCSGRTKGFRVGAGSEPASHFKALL